MKHSLTLIVGDWSNDGHGRTDIIGVSCNYGSPIVEIAFEEGSKKLGFNLSDEVCRDYTDNEIEKEYLDKLEAAGIVKRQERQSDDFQWVEYVLVDKPETQVAYEEDECDVFYANSEAFAALYMAVAQYGDPSIKWYTSRPDAINVGGYGLFY